MATEWISPTWRMPEESNQSKFENYSLDFDGGSQSINCGNVSALTSSSSFTISGWFTQTTLNQYRMLFGQSGGVSSIVGVYTYTDGNMYVDLRNGSSTYGYFDYSTVISADTWFHLAMVFDGSGASNSDRLKLYINNLEMTLTYNATIPTSTSSSVLDFNIGIIAGYSYEWLGKMAQVAVFETSLSAAQITALYNSGTPVNPMALTPLPIAYYPLGGSSTGSSSTLTTPNESVPSATVFDFPSGGADLINCGNKVDFTNAFTLSSWVKTNTTPASYIFYKNATFTVGKDTWYDGGVGNRARVTLTDSNGLSKDFRSNVAPAGATVTVGTVVDLKDGNWHQIVFSYDGVNQGKLYTDGALTYTYDITDGAWAGSLANNTNDLILGSNVTVQTWIGEMSNIQAWETVLTGGEVTTLYNNGVPLLSGTQPQAANLKAWYKMNVDTSVWNSVLNQWEIIDYAN